MYNNQSVMLNFWRRGRDSNPQDAAPGLVFRGPRTKSEPSAYSHSPPSKGISSGKIALLLLFAAAPAFAAELLPADGNPPSPKSLKGQTMIQNLDFFTAIQTVSKALQNPSPPVNVPAGPALTFQQILQAYGHSQEARPSLVPFALFPLLEHATPETTLIGVPGANDYSPMETP